MFNVHGRYPCKRPWVIDTGENPFYVYQVYIFWMVSNSNSDLFDVLAPVQLQGAITHQSGEMFKENTPTKDIAKCNWRYMIFSQEVH